MYLLPNGDLYFILFNKNQMTSFLLGCTAKSVVLNGSWWQKIQEDTRKNHLFTYFYLFIYLCRKKT